MDRTNGAGRVRRTAVTLLGGALVGVFLAACVGQGSGAQPGASAPAASAAAPAANVPLLLQADTVLGSKNLAKTEAGCVQQSRFARNTEIVWRVKVFDPATGKALDDKSLTSVEVKLPDQTLKMHYGNHPKTNPTDAFWAVSFDIPAAYPTGALPYTVVATASDGRTGTFDQFKVAPAVLTVTQEVHASAASGS